MKNMDAEQFLSDIASHAITVRKDDGVYRHLHFCAAKDSWDRWFEIVTWPGSLLIHGDMGTWSFARVEDMFTFFRQRELEINASYWCEKVTGESRFGGPSKKFAGETFKANIVASLDGYDLSTKRKAEIIEALDDEVFGEFCEDDESSIRRALCEFENDGFKFSDTWKINGLDYTYYFLWCLHAIVWGIQQYDALKAIPLSEELAQAKP